MLYKTALLAEKTREHTIAQAICLQMEQNLKTAKVQDDLSMVSFSNRNGEGIVATLKQDDKTLEVLCGNTKLMDAFNVLEKFEVIKEQVKYLE